MCELFLLVEIKLETNTHHQIGETKHSVHERVLDSQTCRHKQLHKVSLHEFANMPRVDGLVGAVQVHQDLGGAHFIHHNVRDYVENDGNDGTDGKHTVDRGLPRLEFTREHLETIVGHVDAEVGLRVDERVANEPEDVDLVEFREIGRAVGTQNTATNYEYKELCEQENKVNDRVDENVA